MKSKDGWITTTNIIFFYSVYWSKKNDITVLNFLLNDITVLN